MAMKPNSPPLLAPTDSDRLWKPGIVGALAGLIVGVIGACLLPSGTLKRETPDNSDRKTASTETVAHFQGTPTGKRYASHIADLLAEVRKEPSTGSKALALARGQIDAWMLSDPIECLNFLCDSSAQYLIPDDTVSAAVLRAAGGSLIRAIDLAKNLKLGRLQQRVIADAYTQIVAADPSSALAIHASLPQYLQHTLGRELAKTWGKAEGESAVRQILKSPAGTESMLGFALQEWAKADPSAALSFLAKTPEEDFHRKSIGRFGQMSILFNQLESEQIVSFLQSLPPSQYRDHQLVGYLGDLIGKNPAKLTEIVGKISGSSNIAAAVGIAASTAGERDPVGARKLLELIPGEQLRGEVASGIAGKMVRNNPKSAAEWVAGLSDPLTKEAAEKKLRQFGVKPL